MSDFQGPLFVIGAPRSGTKLLMKLLNNHPDILLANEFGTHANLLEKWSDVDLQKNFRTFYNDITGTIYYLGHHERVGLDISEDAIIEKITNFNAEQALLVFMRLSASQIENKPYDTKIIGQKSPHLISKTDILKKYYPKAKFIHIIRDVRNCVVSSKKVWNTDIYRYSQRWFNKISALNKEFDTIASNDYINIKYEFLTANPRRELYKICEFLSINFNNSMTVLNSQSENYGDAKGETRVVNQDNKKYLKYLSSKEIKKIESLTFPILKEYNYEYDYDGIHCRLNNIQMRLLQIKDIFNRLIFDIREKGISNIFYIIKLKLAHFKK